MDLLTEEIRLRVRAPFATFRRYVASAYRGTYEVMTPSAAYGFVLNVACVDARVEETPRFQVAVGLVNKPTVAVQLQQTHRSKPIQKSSELGYKPEGSSPTRREFLVDYDGVIGVRCSATFAKLLRDGLSGDRAPPYGLLFLGDNDFLVDYVTEESVPAKWYRRGVHAGERTCRLTTLVDRSIAHPEGVVDVYTPSDWSDAIPESAWVMPLRAV